MRIYRLGNMAGIFIIIFVSSLCCQEFLFFFLPLKHIERAKKWQKKTEQKLNEHREHKNMATSKQTENQKTMAHSKQISAFSEMEKNVLFWFMSLYVFVLVFSHAGIWKRVLHIDYAKNKSKSGSNQKRERKKMKKKKKILLIHSQVCCVRVCVCLSGTLKTVSFV